MLAEVQGSTRAGLVALRDLLARTLESADEKNVASLAGRLESVMARLDSMRVAKGDEVDEITARRNDRRSKGSGKAAAGGDGRR